MTTRSRLFPALVGAGWGNSMPAPRPATPDRRQDSGTRDRVAALCAGLETGAPYARPRSRYAPILGLLAAILAIPAVGQDGLPLSDEHRRWLEEEVVYIISDREQDAFERLQSDGEREAFIAAFWSRRDPEPLTPENEFRIEHYERIEYANARLAGETAIPGWMTDRGRIYIQLGEPDERTTFSSVPGLYPTELWFYLAQEDKLLPPIYVLFFRQYNAGSYIQFNHLIHQPEELLPAQSFPMDDSRMEAYTLLQEVHPDLAHASITMRADRGVSASLVQPEMEQLQTQTLLSDINRAPYRLLDTGWVNGAEVARGLVESDYLFNFVPSSGIARVLPGPTPEARFVHYAIEIEPQHFTVAREEDGNEYFTRFEITGEVVNADEEVIHDFAVEPFLRLTEGQLQDVGARPFTYRGAFPLIAGDYRLRVILKNAARTEYTLFEDEIRVPGEDGGLLSRPLLLHGPPLPSEGDEADYRAWSVGADRFVPNARSVVAGGGRLQAVAAASGHDRLTFRVTPWNAAAEPAEPADPIAQDEVEVSDGVAWWSPSTVGWETGRYLLSLHSGEEERATTLDLTARRGVATPWGLNDSFGLEQPGALASTLAEQWLRAGDHERSRQLFRRALEENPNLGRVRLALGRFALEEGDPRDAVRLLEPALAQAPEDPRVLRLLGDAHRESGNPARAAELYERTLALQAPDAPILNALGWSLAAAGERTRAVSYFERSLDIEPDQPEIRSLLAELRANPQPGPPR